MSSEHKVKLATGMSVEIQVSRIVEKYLRFIC